MAVDEDEIDVLLVASDDEKSDWILNSGSAYHLCRDREVFSTYAGCEGCIWMANNTSSRVVGKGSVRFRMADGRSVMLTEVMHVPNLQKNLISIGMLDSKGCNFDASGGILRVSKRNKEMLWGKKAGGLYRLEGSVQTGGATVRHESSGISKENGQGKQPLHKGTQSKRRVVCTREERWSHNNSQSDVFCGASRLGGATPRWGVQGTSVRRCRHFGVESYGGAGSEAVKMDNLKTSDYPPYCSSYSQWYAASAHECASYAFFLLFQHDSVSFMFALSMCQTPPIHDQSSEELMREIALLEGKILHLERYLLSLYRTTFEQNLPALLENKGAYLQYDKGSQLQVLADQSLKGGTISPHQTSPPCGLAGTDNPRHVASPKASSIMVNMPSQPCRSPCGCKCCYLQGRSLRWESARHVYAIEYPDPLVHFALCSGAYSDPVDLKLAKEEFVQASVYVHKETKIFLPKILDYFAKDMSLDVAGLLEVGLVLWEKGKESKEIREKAAEHFVISAKLNPQNSAAFRYLGHYYRDDSIDHHRALKCYQRAVNLCPDDSQSGEAFCDLLDQGGKETLEAAVCREASDKSPRAFWAFRRLGYLQIHQKKWSEAVPCLQHAIRGYPTCADLWEALGLAYQRLGMFTAANKGVEQFQQALQISPQNISAQYGLASALLGLSKECINSGAFKWGASLLEEASNVAKASTCLVGNISCIWKLHGDIQLAYAKCLPWMEEGGCLETDEESFRTSILSWKRTCLSAAVSACSSYQRALHLASWQANIYTDIAIASDLISSLEKCLKRDTNVWQLPEKMSLGGLLLEGNNNEFWVALGCLCDHSALKQHAFIRALQIDVSLAIAWAYLGKLYGEEGEGQLGRQAFDRARSIDPSLALPWAGMSADLYARELTPDEAYESCFTGCADTAKFQIGLAKLALLSGHLSASQVFGSIQQAVQRAPNYPESHNMNGLVCEARFDYQTAAGAYRLALCAATTFAGKVPKSHIRDISINLARSLCRAGNAVDAVKECEDLDKEASQPTSKVRDSTKSSPILRNISIYLHQTSSKVGVLPLDKLQVRYSMEPSPTLRKYLNLLISTQGLQRCLGWEQGLCTSSGLMEECGLEARVKSLSKEPSHEGSFLPLIERDEELTKDWVGDALRYNLLCPLAWLEHVKHASSSSGAYTTNCEPPCPQGLAITKHREAFPRPSQWENLGKQPYLGKNDLVLSIITYLTTTALSMEQPSRDASVILICRLLYYIYGLESAVLESVVLSSRCFLSSHEEITRMHYLIALSKLVKQGSKECLGIQSGQQHLRKALHMYPNSDLIRYLSLSPNLFPSQYPNTAAVQRLKLAQIWEKTPNSNPQTTFRPNLPSIGNQWRERDPTRMPSTLSLPSIAVNVAACRRHPGREERVLWGRLAMRLERQKVDCDGWNLLGYLQLSSKGWKDTHIASRCFIVGHSGCLEEEGLKSAYEILGAGAVACYTTRNCSKKFAFPTCECQFLHETSLIRQLQRYINSRGTIMPEELLAQACSLTGTDSCLFLCHGTVCMELARQFCDSQFVSLAVRSFKKAKEISVASLPIVSVLLGQAEASIGSKAKWEKNIRLEWFSWPPEMRPAELFLQMHLLSRQSKDGSDSSSRVLIGISLVAEVAHKMEGSLTGIDFRYEEDIALPRSQCSWTPLKRAIKS
ncbi:tetratricopeptide repeat (TPR)-like superfamily protein [Actinidia rufa]|uniref:Tetratricopeptide repeat (TPR)-like superfamily protein n=1 Tax=Actinidia rufa TaxID=165716 RepID=A0A7J0GII4_9ERIC|nr:tetratricopeptide repeat (TPR)-like superfamily protein [Actinidia rufa]